MKKNIKLLWCIALVGTIGLCFTNQQTISQRRTAFWYGWINTCFPDKDWSKTTYVTCGIRYDRFKSNNTTVYNHMKALNPSETKLQEVVEASSND